MPRKYSFVSRHLSDYETVLDLQQQQGDGIMSHVMVLKTKIQLTTHILSTVVQKLVQYQPALRMCVQTEYGANGLVKRFVEKTNIFDFEVSQIFPVSDDWVDSVESECSRPFLPMDNHLWKITFMELRNKAAIDMNTGETINCYVVMFKYSHVLADHRSVFTMLTKQLLAMFKETQDMSVFDTPLFMKPSVDLSYLSVSSYLKKKKITKSSSSKAISGTLGLSQEFLPTDDIKVGITGLTCLTVSTISPGDVHNLESLCHKHCVRPHEVFSLAAVYSLHMTNQANKMTVDGAMIRVCHWLDIRTFQSATGEGDPLGMWSCPVFTKHKIPKHTPKTSEFWTQVKKFASTLKPEEEPWKRTFKEYQNILQEANKQNSEDIVNVRTPKAHVSISYLDARNNTVSPTEHYQTSRQSTMSSSTAAPNRQSATFTGSIEHLQSDYRDLSLEEYYITGSVTPQSVSSMNVSVTQSETSATCTLSRNGNQVSGAFADMFLSIFCKVITNMVEGRPKSYRSRKSAESVKSAPARGVEKLPPYVRAKMMSTSPRVSKV